MTAPSTYLRQLHEAAARRRLEIARILRDAPATTNKQLAEALNVSRNTIALDRKIMVDDLRNQTRTETELMRAEMVGKLESLNEELEKHRTDGKLPISAVHEKLLVHRSIIELLGIRKPVVEKMEVKRTSVLFETSVVSVVDGRPIQSEPKVFELVNKKLALTEGDHEC